MFRKGTCPARISRLVYKQPQSCDVQVGVAFPAAVPVGLLTRYEWCLPNLGALPEWLTQLEQSLRGCYGTFSALAFVGFWRITAMVCNELGCAYAVMCYDRSGGCAVYPVGVYADVDSASDASAILDAEAADTGEPLLYTVWAFPWVLGDPQGWLNLLRRVAVESTGTLGTVYLVVAHGLRWRGRVCEPITDQLRPVAACLDLSTAHTVADRFQSEHERQAGVALPQLYEVWNAPLQLGSVADWSALERRLTRVVAEHEVVS